MLLLLISTLVFFTVSTYSAVLQEDLLSSSLELHFEEDDDLPRVVVPIHYNLELQPLVNEGTFQGHVEITVGCLESTDLIVLHAHHDLDVLLAETFVLSVEEWKDFGSNSSRFLQNERISFSMEHHMVMISKMRRYLYRDWCEIIFEEDLKKGAIYVIKLRFRGNLTSKGIGPFYHANYSGSKGEVPRWYLATDLQSQKARRVFPCFDELNMKATFQLRVIRPASLKAFATMACETTEIIEDTDWVIDHFSATPLMAPESLALIIFDPSSLQPVNPVKLCRSATVHGYVRSHLVDIFESELMYQTIRTLQVMEQYVNMSFPLPDLYLFALPEYLGTEPYGYWGLVMFSEQELERGLVNYQLIQAIVAQWMGHLVTPLSRSRIGFSRGLASYLTHVSLTHIGKNPKYKNSILLGPAFSRQVYYLYSRINGRDDQHFKEIRTTRLCQMLNFTLTETTFQMSFHNFLQEWAFQTFSGEHFFKTMDQQAWKDGTLPSSISTYNIAMSWIKKDHFPVVTVTRNYINHTATIEQHAFIREWPYQTYETIDSLWWIPLSYLSRYNLDLDYILILTWLREEKVITIGNLPDQETFIIINPEDIGMFLVNYDHTNWELLSQYLDKAPLIGRPLIPAETRCKLLSDAMYLALSGELDFPTALDMTLFVRHDKEISVWMTMLTLYEVIYHELLYGTHDTAVLDKYGAYVAYLLTPAYESLKEESLDTKGNQKIYHDLIAFLSQVGYKPALEESQLIMEIMYNSSKDTSKLPTDMRPACSILRWYAEEWDLGLEIVLNSTDHSNQQYLISLLISCTRQPEKLNRIFSIIFLDGDQLLEDDDDIMNILTSVTDYYTFIKFILNNWEEIKEKWEVKIDIWNKILQTATQNFKTRYGFSLVSELYQNHKGELGSARRIVENSLYMVSEKMNGQYKFVRHMGSWLDQHLLLLSSQDIPSSHFMSTNVVY